MISSVPAAPLAYLNQEFVHGDEARPLRILAEYLEPFERLHRERIHDTVVFFGSARLREDDPELGHFYREARELARRLTEWASTLSSSRSHVVCTGGAGGIMEAANRGAADAGGKSIGLNIGLAHEQRPNGFVTPELLFEFHYFFMRKLWFAYPARAMVVFPGGFGTLDELSEMLTLAQTKKLDRHIPIILYGSAYWNQVIDFEAFADFGMIDRHDLSLFRMADDVDAALDLLREELAPPIEPSDPSLARSHTPEEDA